MTNARALLFFFLLLPLAAHSQVGFPPFTNDFPPEEFAQRRAKIYDTIGVGAIALVQGAPSPTGYVRFRQTNEFYYLCGIEVPHAYLLLDGTQRRAALYLPHRMRGREPSEGKLLSAEDEALIKQLSGIDAVYGLNQLAPHLGRLTGTTSVKTLYTPFSPAEGFATSRDLAIRSNNDVMADPFDGQASREDRLVQLLRLRFPQFEVRDLSPILDNLRLIKSPREIALITKATILSGMALMECMRSTKPGIMEYELDAAAKYIYYRHGAQGEAYFSIVASGPNALIGHYHAGKRRMEDGDLVLMDFAPDFDYYMGDLTRTWPVNGKFSPSQRELFAFYIGCYRSVLKAIRPGATAQAILQDVVKEMDGILAETKFSRPSYDKAAHSFVDGFRRSASSPRARLGHWVGMATHDVGEDSGPLRAGMVFTIEPAFSVPEEQISIRFEDLIVVTEMQAEILSDFLPMDIDGIEKLMREPGLLQRYPRSEMMK